MKSSPVSCAPRAVSAAAAVAALALLCSRPGARADVVIADFEGDPPVYNYEDGFTANTAGGSVTSVQNVAGDPNQSNWWMQVTVPSNALTWYQTFNSKERNPALSQANYNSHQYADFDLIVPSSYVNSSLGLVWVIQGDGQGWTQPEKYDIPIPAKDTKFHVRLDLERLQPAANTTGWWETFLHWQPGEPPEGTPQAAQTFYIDNLTFINPAPGGPSTWFRNGGGDWNDPTSWRFSAIPNAAGAVAEFGSKITAPHTISTETAVTVGTLRFNNANTYQIAGNGSLTVQASTGSGVVEVVQGTHKVNLPLFFASDSSVTVAAGATLTIADPMTIRAGKIVTKSGDVSIQAPLTIEAGGALVAASGATGVFGAPALGAGAKIDLKNTSMTVDYRGQASPGSTIKGQIAAAEIMSSSATSTTGLGWKDDSASQSILVKYTHLGDTNLDGQVDVIDLGNLATAWQTAGAWVNGDSNYDGFVDVIDLGLLATNWQAGVGNPLGPGSLDHALAAYGLPGVSVPEPGSFALIGLLGGWILGRERHGG